jgi:hypothetical protein
MHDHGLAQHVGEGAALYALKRRQGIPLKPHAGMPPARFRQQPFGRIDADYVEAVFRQPGRIAPATAADIDCRAKGKVSA